MESITSAALVEYDWAPGLVYDTRQDVTWLKDANYAQTSGYDDDGMMDWTAAMGWTENLEYESAGIVYGDWMLADSPEYYYLYWFDGVNALSQGPFMNVRPNFYWSRRETSTNHAYSRHFLNGQEGWYDKDLYFFYAWAVRDGAPVPVPSAVWLFASGLIGLAGFRKGLESRIIEKRG